MYAVIETGGKQYRVSPGDIIYAERIDADENATVKFEKVLFVAPEEGPARVGNPAVEGATVDGRVVKQGKSKKITVFTYRPKKDSKRKIGHRQRYTKIEITAINA